MGYASDLGPHLKVARGVIGKYLIFRLYSPEKKFKYQTENQIGMTYNVNEA